MKRLLIDQKKLNQEALSVLLATYPDGYGDNDIISFKNANGEIIQAVELRTDDILYLVKIGTNTSHFIPQNQMQDDATDPKEMEALPDTELELDMEQEEAQNNGSED